MLLFEGRGQARRIAEAAAALCAKRPLLVCGKSFDALPFSGAVSSMAVARFGGFSPNPERAQAERGLDAYLESSCDSLLAVGGGSAMDVAKCVKLLLREKTGAVAPLMAVPTTAGSGSEATRTAVIYENRVKHSYADDALLPGAVILDADALDTLPARQRACTYLDALCQAMESAWARAATDESRVLAYAAVSELLACGDAYLFGSDLQAAERALHGAYTAGRAINLTKTTAPHAMSYQITMDYGIPHGGSVALCMRAAWDDVCARADADTRKTLDVLEQVYCGAAGIAPGGARAHFSALVERLGVLPPQRVSADALSALAQSVDIPRLANHPVPMTARDVQRLYSLALKYA